MSAKSGFNRLKDFICRLKLYSFNGRFFALISGSQRLLELSEDFYRFASGDSKVADPMYEEEFRRLEMLGYICLCRVPYSIDLEGVRLNCAHSCNLSCSYCNFGRGRYGDIARERYMSWDIARRAIDLLMEKTGRNKLLIIFWGGEPLLNFSLIKRCCEYALQNSSFQWEFAVQTNGTLVDEGIARYLSRHGFTVTVSVDGTPGMHNMYRVDHKGKGTFDQVAAGVDRLGRAGVKRIHLSCTLAGENAHRYEEAYEFLKKRFQFAFVQVALEDSLIFGGGAVDYSELKRDCFLLEQRLEQGSVDSIQTPGQLVPAVLMGHQPVQHGCVQGSRWMFVAPDGDIYLCQHSVIPDDDAFRLGNVYNGFDDEKALALTSVYPDKCNSCHAFSLCTFNGCHLNRKKQGTPPEHICEGVYRMVGYLIEYCSSMPFSELAGRYVSKEQSGNFSLEQFLIFMGSFSHIIPLSIVACSKCSRMTGKEVHK